MIILMERDARKLGQKDAKSCIAQDNKYYHHKPA